MTHFVATSQGLTATRWLSLVLASRNDVYVAHGHHPLDSIITANLHNEIGSSDEESFVAGVSLAGLYETESISSMFARFRQIMPDARAYGCVHSYHLKILHRRLTPADAALQLRILNVVRHPVAYIDSHTALVRSSAAYPEVYAHYRDRMFAIELLQRYPELKLFPEFGTPDFIAFAVSCKSAANQIFDFAVRAQHIQMEKLTQDPKLLQSFCQHLTGLSYPIESLERLIGDGPVNRHRRGGPRKPEDIYASWPIWKQDLAHMLLPAALVDAFEKLGYNIGMLRMKWDRGPSIVDPTPPPRHPELAQQGESLLQQSRWAEAKQSFQEALSLMPGWPRAQIGLWEARIGAGDWQPVLGELMPVLEGMKGKINLESPDLWYLATLVCLRAGMLDEANTFARKLAQVTEWDSPRAARLDALFAEVNFAHGVYEDGVGSFGTLGALVGGQVPAVPVCPDKDALERAIQWLLQDNPEGIEALMSSQAASVLPELGPIVQEILHRLGFEWTPDVPVAQEDPEAAEHVANAFMLGNYSYVVDHADASDWRLSAARGIFGLPGAEEELARFPGEEPQFYRAVAAWMLGKDQEALQLLQGLSLEHARNLLNLISKPKIKVLSQLPWASTGPQALLTGIQADPKFEVANIGPQDKQRPSAPYASIHSYTKGVTPDFFICQMVEWHLIPPDLQSLACPIFGHTADYDIHYQAVYPWLQLFDELVVTDHTEWMDVYQLVERPVSTFPKAFGVDASSPPPSLTNRPNDFFISGTLFQTYHPDKARLITEVLRMEGVTPSVLNGFGSHTTYNYLLESSKATFTFYRRPGGTVTRGLDALSRGCAIVVQQESVLKHFLSEEEGLFFYDDQDPASLSAAMRGIVANWDTVGPAAIRGAARVRQEFSLEKASSQYFRFLTFLAARPRLPRKMVDTQDWISPRTILRKGWLPLVPSARQDWAFQTVQREQARLARKEDYRGYINQTRELLLYMAGELGSLVNFEFVDTTFGCRFPDATVALMLQTKLNEPLFIKYRQLIFQIFHSAIAKFPNALVLQFNYIRTALHLGSDEEAQKALALAHQLCAQPPDFWELDPMDDVLPWDLFPCFFNYRAYFDQLTAQTIDKVWDPQPLIKMILASVQHYIGTLQKDATALIRANELDPEFPVYRYRLAEHLLSENKASDDAVKLLLSLQDSTLYDRVVERLETLAIEGRLPTNPTLRAATQKLLNKHLRLKPNFMNLSRNNLYIRPGAPG